MTLGDFDAGSVLYFKFTTIRPSTGAPYTLAGTPAVSVYKNNSTTQSIQGVALTADFDSIAGLNHVEIDTSADGTFYAAGSFFDIVVTTGTVDSVSSVGLVVGRFTLRKTSALKPTSAGRTLDVSAGGEAGVDWANVGSQSTSVDLSGTTVGVVALVQAMANDSVTSAAVATGAVAKIQSGLATDANLTTVAGYLDTEIAAIKAVTDKIDTALVIDGAVYQFTANALELAPSGGGGGTGSGARSVTVTVNDGSNVLESARVRFTKGAESYVTSTNASGVATFSLDDGTWTVTISLAGYTFTPTTLVVNGTETATYSMDLVDDVPEIDGLINAQATCVDEFGEPAPGVVVSIRLKDTPSGYGLFGSSAPQSATSDEDGVVRFTGVIKGAVYTIKSPRDVRMYTVPTGATSPHTLPNIVR